MIRKIIIIFSVIGILILLGLNSPYKYSNDNTVKYIKDHKGAKSRSMCAWYCTKALKNGGCWQCPIVPGYAYNKILLQLGFNEIPTENYIPIKGDISVLPRNSKSCFGHIAIYDGHHWISDFEQTSIYPGESYKQVGKYQIFRIEDGWHWIHLNFTISELFDYINCLFIGYKQIKWLYQ